MVNDATKEAGVDRDVFGEYIHKIKAELGMKPNDNFTYQELLQYARKIATIEKIKLNSRCLFWILQENSQ